MGKTYSTDGLPDMGTGIAEDDGSQEKTELTYTLTKDVTIDNTDGATEATVTISTNELMTAATQLQVNTLNYIQAASNLVDYAETQEANTLMFMPATIEGETINAKSNCISDDYKFGHWFKKDGTFTEANSSEAVICSQLNPTKVTFKVSMPTPKNGDYKTAQALRYYDGESYATLFVNLNITVKGTIKHSASVVEIFDTISFETSATDYTGATIALREADLENISGCFGISADEIRNDDNWETWSTNGPSEGKITLYGVQSDGKTLKDTCSTAEGYGFWFNDNNDVCAWGSNFNSTIFAEYNVENATFQIGQYPGALTAESTPNITLALVFNESGMKYIALVHIKINQTVSTDINDIPTDKATISDIYSIDGRKNSSIQKGLNILKLNNGTAKKIYFNETR